MLEVGRVVHLTDDMGDERSAARHAHGDGGPLLARDAAGDDGDGKRRRVDGGEEIGNAVWEDADVFEPRGPPHPSRVLRHRGDNRPRAPQARHNRALGRQDVQRVDHWQSLEQLDGGRGASMLAHDVGLSADELSAQPLVSRALAVRAGHDHHAHIAHARPISAVDGHVVTPRSQRARKIDEKDALAGRPLMLERSAERRNEGDAQRP